MVNVEILSAVKNGSLAMNCYEMIAKNYKFYLSFENSVSFQFKKKKILFIYFSIALQRLCNRKIFQNS